MLTFKNPYSKKNTYFLPFFLFSLEYINFFFS
uniref:Uncharacterized protein n=1 Tax=Siphoviridae sp. cttaA39 TaxID=2827960 RepID=A0A8S5TMS8_9CAUD|nr:MAG TPA: hypothetical protein [Siphoviridae sp. cttaA39]